MLSTIAGKDNCAECQHLLLSGETVSLGTQLIPQKEGCFVTVCCVSYSSFSCELQLGHSLRAGLGSIHPFSVSSLGPAHDGDCSGQWCKMDT
jgi:hypothetical protein